MVKENTRNRRIFKAVVGVAVVAAVAGPGRAQFNPPRVQPPRVVPPQHHPAFTPPVPVTGGLPGVRQQYGNGQAVGGAVGQYYGGQQGQAVGQVAGGGFPAVRQQLGDGRTVGAAVGGAYGGLATAGADGWVLVTRDRDYGGLVFAEALGRGVIYLRMLPSTIQAVHAELARVLTTYATADLLGALVVVEPGRHRVRRPMTGTNPPDATP